MKRKPRKASDGVFADGMGLDIAFQGVIITLLVLASFFAGMFLHNGSIDMGMLLDGVPDAEGVTMASSLFRWSRSSTPSTCAAAAPPSSP